MRLIIIQISDMHCTASASRYTKKIKKAALAIKSIGKFDKAVFVFSGDLVNTASPNEFKAAKSVINAFLKNLSEQLGCASIPVVIVPGNHDIVISDDARKIHDIIGWQKAKKMDAHLFEEMGHLENFFKYAKSNRYFTCDIRNPLYVSEILPFEDVKIQFCILNSAPFSTREPDDKQVHYFPSYVEDSLSRSDEATLKITVMHHHFEWFEWDTKEMLKRLIASDDFTFFGHDHKAEELSTQYADGKKYDIIMGGEFNLDVGRDSAFNAVTYDSETGLIERFEFNWEINEGVFKPENRGYITKKSNKLIPSKDFLDKLLSDSAKVDGYTPVSKFLRQSK